jgi:spore germination protein YaaH
LIAALQAFADDVPGRAMLAYLSDSEKKAPDALRARFHYFNQLAVDVYTADANGNVRGKTPEADLAFAQSKGLPTYATVSNYAGHDFNAGIAHSIITSQDHTRQFIVQMLGKLAEGHYRGINVDFESVQPQDRAALSDFLATIGRAMKAAGYLTIVSVPAEGKDDPSNSWSGAFDYNAIGAAVDTVQLMTYDENGPWGAPGPVAGLDWVEACVTYAVSVIPPGKISLGVPAFGYDWDLTDKSKDSQFNWDQVPTLLSRTGTVEQWDADSSSPFVTYESGGRQHIVWFENARSLGLKAQLVAKYHLGGLSVWALGQEDDAFWQALIISSP